jgi:hypothetical protein
MSMQEFLFLYDSRMLFAGISAHAPCNSAWTEGRLNYLRTIHVSEHLPCTGLN